MWAADAGDPDVVVLILFSWSPVVLVVVRVLLVEDDRRMAAAMRRALRGATCGRRSRTDWGFRAAPVCTCGIDSREAGTMRKLIFGMNVTLDGYIAAEYALATHLVLEGVVAVT